MSVIVMAIDYGDAHTGVAISDPTGFLAGTTTTIHSRKEQVVLEELTRLVRENRVEELVMASPGTWTVRKGPGHSCTGTLPPKWSK